MKPSALKIVISKRKDDTLIMFPGYDTVVRRVNGSLLERDGR